MPLINNSVYFIHIPRTGGRFLNALFCENSYNYQFYHFKDKMKLQNVNMELPHLQYPYYTRLFKEKNTKCFTIIRDPLSRFKSMLRCNSIDLERVLNDKDGLIKYMNYHIYINPSNWFLPQVNFITKNTFLWKFENGLDKDFFNWLYKNFNFTFEKKDVVGDKSDALDTRELNLNKKQMDLIIDLVKEYYYQDYKILGY